MNNLPREKRKNKPSRQKRRAKPLLAICGGRCAYCGKFLNSSMFSRDHIIPKSRGGSHLPANILPACKGCNLLKANLSLPEFKEMAVQEWKSHSREFDYGPWFDIFERFNQGGPSFYFEEIYRNMKHAGGNQHGRENPA